MPHDDAPDDRVEDQDGLVEELLAEDADVAGDIAEVGPDAWAIHGHIPVDGEVILAEYRTFEEASSALDRLPPNGRNDLDD